MSLYDEWRAGGRDCAHDPRSPAYDSTRDEYIHEETEADVERLMADRALVATELDEMCGWSEPDPDCGNALTFCVALADALIAGTDEAAIAYMDGLRDRLHARLYAATEPKVAREYDANMREPV